MSNKKNKRNSQNLVVHQTSFYCYLTRPNDTMVYSDNMATANMVPCVIAVERPKGVSSNIIRI